MARLPTVGGDEGNWGTILNDFLSQSLDSTGALNDNTVGASQVIDASITSTKLSSGVQASLSKADASISATTAAATFVQTVNGTGPDGSGNVTVTGTQGPKGDPGTAAVLTGTSSTSTAVAASGSKTMTVTSGLSIAVGSRVRIAVTASPTTNWMEGIVTSYSGTSLVFTADLAAGSGTYAAWTVIAGIGSPGATGAAGAGIANGGSAGQLLVKNSATNYDTAWTNPGFASVVVTTGSETRPSAAFVLWVGVSTQPTNMATGDVWMKAA